MAIDMKFFGANASTVGGDGHSLTGTINGGAVAAGDVIVVHAVGGTAGGGLNIPTVTDNGSPGTGWTQIGDSLSTMAGLRTTRFWKLMVGGETTVTVDWTTTGTARCFEAVVCRGIGALNEAYKINEGLANTHFGEKDYGCNDGSGTLVTPSGNGQIYIGCTAMPTRNYNLAQIAGVGMHDNNGVNGDGQNVAGTIGVGCIMHINDSAAAHLTSDCLRYESNATSLTETFDSFIGIRTAAVSAPANTVAPAVTGTAKSGQTLSCTTGTWTGSPTPTYAYVWKAGGVVIGGATSSTFLLTDTQHGSTITCTVTATNSQGSASATSNTTASVTYANPSNSVAPVITGHARVGSTLHCSTGTWSGTSIVYTYQWKLGDGTSIGGATAHAFKPTITQLGLTIKCTVTATNDGAAVAATTSATAAVLAATGVWLFGADDDNRRAYED